ncbi:hypothetical protein ASF00_14900 [Sphingomonas sp. Leaf34]|uniref:excalibur calcium-binding domain-containing protein n=1 Tax=Sphingomonas sp. Leaf34 TaxID=1736216 RepID=UPI0006F398A8|nr:excalibur calcium-binding domain-containing protein [Sphingomonas sp. Leaf34]KQN24148.1 hypothetical protein ASF00_14900 [Sphingomonas sp. Leaf34]
MGRSFIIATAGASALMFAGVWTATAPASVVAASDPGPSAPMSIRSPEANASEADAVVRSRPIVPVAAEDSAPYNVVRAPYGRPSAPQATQSQRSVYYSGCREARAAGAAPIYRGQPGYRPGMDGDNDGIACEPYRG